MSTHTIEITDASFEQDVLQSDKPILVDFWAPWCAPCKIIAPVLDEVGEEYKDSLIIGKLNVDDNPDSPSRYGVRGIPTLLLFKHGELVMTKVGSLSKTELKGLLSEHL